MKGTRLEGNHHKKSGGKGTGLHVFGRGGQIGHHRDLQKVSLLLLKRLAERAKKTYSRVRGMNTGGEWAKKDGWG